MDASATVQQAGMNSDRHRFGNRIDRVGFLPSQPNPDYALFVLHEQTNRFPAKLPHVGEFSDAVVTLKGRVGGLH